MPPHRPAAFKLGPSFSHRILPLLRRHSDRPGLSPPPHTHTHRPSTPLWGPTPSCPSHPAGKTLQTISLLGYLAEFRGITGPHMVVVPKSTLHNWLNEFRRWCPSIKAVKFHGNAEERQLQKDTICQPGKFDVVVTSYEMVIKVGPPSPVCRIPSGLGWAGRRGLLGWWWSPPARWPSRWVALAAAAAAAAPVAVLVCAWGCAEVRRVG